MLTCIAKSEDEDVVSNIYSKCVEAGKYKAIYHRFEAPKEDDFW